MTPTIYISDIANDLNWALCALCITVWKKLPHKLQLFALGLIVLPFFMIPMEYLRSMGLHNLFWKHVITHFEFVMIGALYLKLFEDSRNQKLLILFCTFFYSAYACYATLNHETFAVYPATSAVVANCVYCTYALVYYYKMYKEEKVLHLEKDPLFSINTGLFLYALSTMFLFISLNYIVYSLEIEAYNLLEWFDSLLFILREILIANGIILYVFYSKKQTNNQLIF